MFTFSVFFFCNSAAGKLQFIITLVLLACFVVVVDVFVVAASAAIDKLPPNKMVAVRTSIATGKMCCCFITIVIPLMVVKEI
jgi:hypothetical protein